MERPSDRSLGGVRRWLTLLALCAVAMCIPLIASVVMSFSSQGDSAEPPESPEGLQPEAGPSVQAEAGPEPVSISPGGRDPRSGAPGYETRAPDAPYLSKAIVSRRKVVKGDTLAAIAVDHYGEAGNRLVGLLGRRNRSRRGYGLHHIEPGQELVLPELVVPATTGDKSLDAATVAFHRAQWETAIVGLRAYIANADDDDAYLAEALYMLGHSELYRDGAHRWLPSQEPLEKGSAAERQLEIARRHFERLLDVDPSHERADRAEAWLAGIDLRLGQFGSALGRYRTIKERWPDGAYADQRADVNFCLLAMLYRCAKLNDGDRASLEAALSESSELAGELVELNPRLLAALESDTVRLFGTSVASDDVVERAYEAAGMRDFGLRVSGVTPSEFTRATRAVRWLNDLGQYAEAAAMGRTVWEHCPASRSDARFAETYARSLLHAGDVESAFEIASLAGHDQLAWAVAANVAQIDELEAIVERAPEWLEDLPRLKYVVALREFAAGRYDRASELLWRLISEDPDAPITSYAFMRLVEIRELGRAPELSRRSGAGRRFALAAAGIPDSDPSKSVLDLVGGAMLSDDGRKEIIGALTAIDDLRTRQQPELTEFDDVRPARLRSRRSRSDRPAVLQGAPGAPLIDYIAAQTRSVLHGYAGSQMPASSREALARGHHALEAFARGHDAVRSLSPVTGQLRSQVRRSFFEFDRWERFHFVLQSVIPQLARDLDITDADDFEARLGGALDLAWDALYWRDAASVGLTEADVWFGRGRYFYHFDPFLQPGQYKRRKLRRTWVASSLDARPAVMSTRLRGATTRLATRCFENALHRDPGRADAAYSIGLCHKRIARHLDFEMRDWCRGAIGAAGAAGLISPRLHDLLKRSQLRSVRASFRGSLPRGKAYTRAARNAIAAFSRVADMAKETNWRSLRDDALGEAGSLSGFGLGEIDAAVAYYDAGIELNGDAREVLEFLRGAVSERRSTLPEEVRSLAPLASLVTAFVHGDRPDDAAFLELEHFAEKGAGPLLDYVRFRRGTASGGSENIEELVEGIVGRDWTHPLAPYLLETWYASAVTPDAKTAMMSWVRDHLDRHDFGLLRFHVQTILARLAIDLDEEDLAREALARARSESPFRTAQSVLLESRRFQERFGTESEGEEPALSEPADERLVYVGNRLVLARRVK